MSKRLRFVWCTCVTLLFFVTLPSLAQKVYIDYDRATPFSQFRTFQFRQSTDDLRDYSPRLHRAVTEGFRALLVEGFLKEVASDPDLYVTYYSAEKQRLRLNTNYFGYSYPSTWHRGPYWSEGYVTSTNSVSTFSQGTLIIDIWEVAEERLVWRGIASATISDHVEKNEKKIEKALKKLSKQWEKMYEYAPLARAQRKKAAGGD